MDFDSLIVFPRLIQPWVVWITQKVPGYKDLQMGNLWENPSSKSLGRWVTPSIPSAVGSTVSNTESSICDWEPRCVTGSCVGTGHQSHWNPDSVFWSGCAPRLPCLACARTHLWALSRSFVLQSVPPQHTQKWVLLLYSFHSIPVCALVVGPGWEPDLCKARCPFIQTFSFFYNYSEVLLSTSRVAQPIILISADILGRKIFPKIGYHIRKGFCCVKVWVEELNESYEGKNEKLLFSKFSKIWEMFVMEKENKEFWKKQQIQ